VSLVNYIFAGSPPPGDPDGDGVPNCWAAANGVPMLVSKDETKTGSRESGSRALNSVLACDFLVPTLSENRRDP